MRLTGLALLVMVHFFFTDLVSQSKFELKGLESMDQFRSFLAIPNDANNMEDILKNVDWCKMELEKRGMKTTFIPTDTRPLLLAEYAKLDKNVPTVMFYFHADGQSVDPQYWFQDDPYVAVLKTEVPAQGWVTINWDTLTTENYDPEWRIFARSSSDSKGNIMMFLMALDMLKKEGKSLPYHLKVIIDFEEEKSSPSLPKAVEDYREELACDMLAIYDGPRHVSGLPSLAFGARGIATLSLTVYGPVFAQHSGHYGNYVPNPALRLSQLLASMKDDRGRVIIPGFYDGITIDDKTRAILKAVPDDERLIKARLGVAQEDAVASSYQESLQYPSLNIHGMASGWVGAESRTIIPSQAVAEIDIRLVKESDPARLIQLVKDHIVQQGYFITSEKPTQHERLANDKVCRLSFDISYEAFRTDFDAPVGLWLTEALRNAFGQMPVRERTMGGSIPISPFVNVLNAPAVVIPLANKDNNQHSPNENLRLGNYMDGIKSMYYILSTPVTP